MSVPSVFPPLLLLLLIHFTNAAIPHETLFIHGDDLGKEVNNEQDRLRLLQISDGVQLVRSVLDYNDLVMHCEVTTDPAEVTAFTETMTAMAAMRNRTETTVLNSAPPFTVAALAERCSETREAPSVVTRRKRFLIAPGTNWCGMGNRAEHSRQLGDNADVDRCCMEHDGCPYFIPRVSTRFGYYNWRTHTLSYCACDHRFYKCLKEAKSTTAELLGQFFFNVINRACFDLQRDKVCSDYNWWGSCRKWKTGLVALVQDTPRF